MKKQTGYSIWDEHIETFPHKKVDNDWYVLPLVTLIAVIIAVPIAIGIYGTDSFIETVGSIIDSAVN